MLDLMIGTDAVQRRTRRSLETGARQEPKRSRRQIAPVRMTTAAALRALADRLEPSRPAAANPSS
jgi:hypothetical protein